MIKPIYSLISANDITDGGSESYDDDIDNNTACLKKNME